MPTLRTHAPALLLLFIAGCGGPVGSRTDSLTVTGTTRGAAFEAKGPWTLAEDGPKGTTYQDGDVWGPTFVSTLVGVDEDDGRHLMIDFESGLLLKPNMVGPGRWTPRVEIARAPYISPDDVSSVTGETVVERVRFSGHGRYPLELTLRTDSTVTFGGGDTANISGTAIITSQCFTAVGVSPASFCGEDQGPGWSFSESADVPPVGDDSACPQELVSIYAPPGTATVQYAKASSVKFGEGESIPCMNLERNNHVLCGATRTGVSADGCTWTVDVYATSATVTVNAVADASCTRAKGRYCAYSNNL